MLRDIYVTPEHIDHIDVARHIAQIAIDFLTKNLRHIWVIDGNRDDVETRVLQGSRYLTRGL